LGPLPFGPRRSAASGPPLGQTLSPAARGPLGDIQRAATPSWRRASATRPAGRIDHSAFLCAAKGFINSPATDAAASGPSFASFVGPALSPRAARYPSSAGPLAECADGRPSANFRPRGRPVVHCRPSKPRRLPLGRQLAQPAPRPMSGREEPHPAAVDIYLFINFFPPCQIWPPAPTGRPQTPAESPESRL